MTLVQKCPVLSFKYYGNKRNKSIEAVFFLDIDLIVSSLKYSEAIHVLNKPTMRTLGMSDFANCARLVQMGQI